jgi:hypothetical protein
MASIKDLIENWNSAEKSERIAFIVSSAIAIILLGFGIYKGNMGLLLAGLFIFAFGIFAVW